MNYGQKPAVFTGRVPTSYEWKYSIAPTSGVKTLLIMKGAHLVVAGGFKRVFLCLSLVEEDLDVDIMFCCWVETTSF